MAPAGTVTTPFSVVTCTLASMNWPGQSWSPALGKTDFSFRVPLFGSMALSMSWTVPMSRTVPSSRDRASTSTGPAARAAQMAGTSRSGRGEMTAMGFTWLMTTSPPGSLA